MKDWKVVDVRALAENSKRKVYAAAFALLAVLSLVFCVGLCGAQKAWADEPEVDLGVPAHVKALAKDDAGKWYLTLDVTGESQSVEGKTKANVVVVLDTSGSMLNEGIRSFEYATASSDSKGDKYGLVGGEYVRLRQDSQGAYYYRSDRKWIEYDTDNGLFVRKETNTSRIEAAKSAIDDLAGSLLRLNTAESPDAVQLALVTFNDQAQIVKTSEDANWFTNLSDFESNFKSVDAEYNTATNWEDALSFANGIEGDSDPTYVVFVSDGNPTFRNTKGEYEVPDDNEFLGVHWWNESAPHGSGSDSDSTTVERCYDHAKDDAKAICDANKEFYAIGAFGNVSRMQGLVNHAYNGSDSVDAPEGHYFAATDHEDLEAAFGSIILDITKDYTYTNVKITDVMSEYVDVVVPEGTDQPVFAYKKDGVEWTAGEGAPVARYVESTKTVTWDLSGIGALEDVVYSVTFQVELNQTAYDTVAGLTSGDLSYDAERYPNIKNDNGSYSVYTNERATLDYVSQKTVNGGDPEKVGEGSVGYDSPDMSALSVLTVSKIWGAVPVGFDKEGKTVVIEVKQDGEDYKSVTLNKGNGWTQALAVPVGYEYSVSEVPGLGDGWTTLYSSSKDAIDDKNAVAFKGEEVAQSASVFVTNKYKAEPANASISVKKELKGRAWTNDDSFEFTLTALDGAPMPDKGGETVTITDSTAGHAASFGTITYTAAGTYQYRISETSDPDKADGITYAASQTVEVKVTDDGKGNLEAEVDNPPFTFINTYGAGAVTLDGPSALKVTKELNGRGWTSGDSFGFTLEAVTPNAPMPSNSSVIIGYDDEVKAASFGSITYTAVGTYQYRILEDKGGTAANGITYDGHKCVVTVEVSDNLKGQLVASVSYEGSMTFTNTYSAEPKDSSLTGDPDGSGEGYVPVTKELTGRDLVAGEFEFQLTNADGTVVAKGTNDAEGKVSMKSVTFSEPGTYSYTLSEVQGNAERVTYDASEYAVTAEVVDNGNGTMSVVWYAASEDQPNGLQEIVFENSYEAEEVAPPVIPDPGVDGEPEPEPEAPAVSDDSDDKEPILAKTGDATFLLLTGVGVLAVLAAGVCLFARRRLS